MLRCVFFTLLMIFSLFADDTAFDSTYDNTAETIDSMPLKKRPVYVENSFRLRFGDVAIFGLSPSLMYRVHPRLALGVGVNYEFLHDDTLDVNSHIWGTRLVADVKLFQNIGKSLPNTSFGVYLQQEFLNLEESYFLKSGNERFWEANSLAGIKIKQAIGPKRRFALGLLILWRVTESEVLEEFYGNPVVKLGFSVNR